MIHDSEICSNGSGTERTVINRTRIHKSCTDYVGEEMMNRDFRHDILCHIMSMKALPPNMSCHLSKNTGN